MKTASSPSAAKNHRAAAAGFCALTLPLLSLAGALPASAAEIGQVTVPGSHGRELGCRADWDIDCPVLTKDGATGLFTGTFEVPAGSYEYWAMATDTEGLGAFYGVDGQVGGEKYSYTTEGGPVTFTFDPKTNVVSVQTGGGADAPGDAETPVTPVTPGAPAEPEEPAPNVLLRAWWDNFPEFEFHLDIPDGADVFWGDWDGDHVDTLGWRVGNEMFFTSANETGGGTVTTNWYGLPTDQVLVGDWDGDGLDTISVRRGNVFHINNDLYSGRADLFYAFGNPADEVLVGDWDGDRVDTVMLRRGNAFHVNNKAVPTGVERVFWYGIAGEPAIAGDLRGAGKDHVIIKRGREFHIRYTTTTGNADRIDSFGEAGDLGLVGEWDGDGDQTIGVFKR